MKEIVILTGSELRHIFFRKYLAEAQGICVVSSFCEGAEKSYEAFVKKQEGEVTLRTNHVIARQQSEEDFFRLFANTADQDETGSQPIFIPKGTIDDPVYVKEIIRLDPDLIVAYGCSFIKSELLTLFKGRFLNVHLGLSPYYMGSATNYWPLVHGKPECVGATFMHMDSGLDTGKIIHQIRADIVWGDTPSSIGNRLIVGVAQVYCDIITKFNSLKDMPQPLMGCGQTFRQRDYDEESVIKLYENFNAGMIQEYLEHKIERDMQYPIVQNPEFTD